MAYQVLFLFFFFLATYVPVALASPAEEPQEKPPSPQVLDLTREFIGGNLNSLANRLDSFFATERADDELGRSSLRIRKIHTIRERAPFDEEIRYRINLKLPHLEEKFRFDYGKKKDKDKDKDKDKEQVPSSEEVIQKSKLNSLKTGWTFNADAGVSVAVPPKLVTRARLRKNFDAGTFIHRFVEQVTYITDESGLTELTLLQSDHRLTDSLLFRFINSKQWRVLKKNFETVHGPTLLHALTEKDALSYNFLMTNVLTHGSYFVVAYTASINYRRSIYKNWVYLDLIPGIDFPKQWSFRRTPFAVIQLEFLFGG